MLNATVLPFRIQRGDSVIKGGTVTTTNETIDGLLRLEEHRLVVQWRLERTTDLVGPEIRSDRKLEPVREAIVPLAGLAACTVRGSWWPWSRSIKVVLTAADMQAFEAVAGPRGLQLSHPAELVIAVRAQDRQAAREFASDVELAVATLAMKRAEEGGELPPGQTAAWASGILPSTQTAQAAAKSTVRPEGTRHVPTQNEGEEVIS